MKKEITHLDYISQIINATYAARENKKPVLWHRLRSDLKEKYRNEAKEAFNDWVEVETKAKEMGVNINE